MLLEAVSSFSSSSLERPYYCSLTAREAESCSLPGFETTHYIKTNAPAPSGWTPRAETCGCEPLAACCRFKPFLSELKG